MQKLNTFSYTLVFALCFLFFSHTDPLYVIGQSFSYLTGHIDDFYDYNNQIIGKVPYLPTIYSLIAIWMFPLKLFNIINLNDFQNWLMNEPAKNLYGNDYSIILIWYKSLLTFFSVLTYLNLKKISKLIPGNTLNNGAIFASSPFFLFIVFIFSGYDIFSVYFTTLGFYYYLKNDLKKFALFFSIAISCKFFALVIFIPLLLLKEKKLLKLAEYFLIAISLCLTYYLYYKNNTTFLENALYVVKDKTGIAKLDYYKLLLISSYSLMCIYCYKFISSNNNEVIKVSIFTSYVAYCFIFIGTPFHPNWLLIIIPFSSMIYSYVYKYKKLLAIEFLGYFSYIVLVANIWKDNVDQKMISQGPMNFITGHDLYFRVSDLLNMHSLDAYGVHLKAIFLIFFYIYLLYPIFLFTNEVQAERGREKYLFTRHIYTLIFIIPCITTLIINWIPTSIENYANIKEIYAQSIRCLYQMCGQ